jgi:hypothetical protein
MGMLDPRLITLYIKIQPKRYIYIRWLLESISYCYFIEIQHFRISAGLISQGLDLLPILANSVKMATLDDALKKQKTSHVLEAPKKFTKPKPLLPQASSTLNIALQNETNSNQVYAYITGLAINNSYSVFLLQSDGVTPYFPSSPSSDGSQLAVDCAIPLGAPGNTRIVTVPQVAGARVWFSINGTLTFLLNPGPGLVEPSVTNPSDPNVNTYWDFCELTFNSFQLFANITYVDFVSLPISLTLTNTSGGTQHVAGMPSNGLDTICAGLRAQDNIDHAGWSSLIVTNNGANLRALSPNNGIVMNSSLFSGYFDPYIASVWAKYASSQLTVNTQASWGNCSGEVSNDSLIFSGIGSWTKPSAADIFSCNSGTFANTEGKVGNISARLCAGFNRSTLLIDSNMPEGEDPGTYYQTSPTNHYSRIVHAANLDGLGYAFPYDDVHPSAGKDLSGSVADGSPQLLTVTVGGNGAHTKLRHRRGFEVEDVPSQLPAMSQKQIAWGGDSKENLPPYSLVPHRDLEKGGGSVVLNGGASESVVALPQPLQQWLDRLSAVSPLQSVYSKILLTYSFRGSLPSPQTRVSGRSLLSSTRSLYRSYHFLYARYSHE